MSQSRLFKRFMLRTSDACDSLRVHGIKLVASFAFICVLHNQYLLHVIKLAVFGESLLVVLMTMIWTQCRLLRCQEGIAKVSSQAGFASLKMY